MEIMENFMEESKKTVQEEICSRCKKTCADCTLKNVTDLKYEIVINLLCNGLAMEEIIIANNLFKSACMKNS